MSIFPPRVSEMQDETLVMFGETVRRFYETHAPPERIAAWKEAGVISRDLWTAAAEAGLLGITISEAYGGLGLDFRFEAILAEETYRLGLDAFGLQIHNAVVAPYISEFGTEDQKQRWLPKLVSGEYVAAIAMSEPGAGSDLRGLRTRARLDGDAYVLNGQKTYITNGQTADLIAVIAKTGEGTGSDALSIIFVEAADCPGFVRGQNLKKIGLEAADTSELFFEDARVPVENLLGEVAGSGLNQLMAKLPQERLMIAVQAVGTMERALTHTIAYVKQRSAFGKMVAEFQNTQFTLAECKTKATVARVFVDQCVLSHVRGELDAVTASMAKYWTTDTECRIIDECLQLHGGAGYMLEYPIAEMYRDARAQRIYGGSNEVMKLLIARSL
jgi:acyl-CoA dehydrogenase